MWFFLAVLVLWGTTSVLGRQDTFVLPPLVLWGWWTISLYVSGMAAMSDTYTTLQSRLMGVCWFHPVRHLLHDPIGPVLGITAR